MDNILEVKYAQTGQSTKINSFGMREMQERAYAYRDSQYLLLKAPPASGKSRALMFIALDKLVNQGIKKVIVAVPERSIGASFRDTELKQFGFFADWVVDGRYNLCGGDADSSQGKIKTFHQFLDDTSDSARILVCTHSTLRYAYQGLDESKFNDRMLAIDEFHHVSADNEKNRLGELLHSVMEKSNAHIVAMTGSYFRGDCVPVLKPEDEAKFDRVTYNYFEQLNGYTYLKSLGIGHHFYQGKYLSAIGEILDTDKKTIIHIPNVNSAESTKEKYDEVGSIIDIIGTHDHTDDFGIQHIKRHSDGKVIKVADLVNDESEVRENVESFLRRVRKPEDIDIIIALNKAKEGFDWPFCEVALTVGYRASLTELVQIIGRCTRDSSNKTHAQFTNLVAKPDAETQEVTVAVNNMLKAITCSLLMEQVLAPNFNFKTRLPNDNEDTPPGTIKIRGLKEPSTVKVKRILESDINDLKAKILQDDTVLKALPNRNLDPEVLTKTLIPKIIREAYPDLSEDEVEEVRQHVVLDSAFKMGNMEERGDKRFIELGNKFINIDDLSIDLIDKINPFQRAYEILSKSLDTKTFKAIQESINASRLNMTQEEAIRLFPEVVKFREQMGRVPDRNSPDPVEREYAEVILYLKDQRRKLGV